jgi:hypothetical protein
MATHHETAHDLLREIREMWEGGNQNQHSGKLSDWEKSFMTDQFEREDQYGENIRLSGKQVAVLERIYGKMAGVKV